MLKDIYLYKLAFTFEHWSNQLMLKCAARNLKAYVNILVNLRKLAPSRNITDISVCETSVVDEKC